MSLKDKNRAHLLKTIESLKAQIALMADNGQLKVLSEKCLEYQTQIEMWQRICKGKTNTNRRLLKLVQLAKKEMDTHHRVRG